MKQNFIRKINPWNLTFSITLKEILRYMSTCTIFQSCAKYVASYNLPLVNKIFQLHALPISSNYIRNRTWK